MAKYEKSPKPGSGRDVLKKKHPPFFPKGSRPRDYGGCTLYHYPLSCACGPTGSPSSYLLSGRVNVPESRIPGAYPQAFGAVDDQPGVTVCDKSVCQGTKACDRACPYIFQLAGPRGAPARGRRRRRGLTSSTTYYQ